MLRIHFTDADLARVTVATRPDPLWEITGSLHRLQTRNGRWAYADWLRDFGPRIHEAGLSRALRNVLLPLFVRAAYFPDFLTPAAGAAGLTPGLKAVLDAPAKHVEGELDLLTRRVISTPPGLRRFAERDQREDLVQLLREYYDAVIAPHSDRILAGVTTDRLMRSRALLSGGVAGLLGSLTPRMRWRPPVLEVDYPAEDRHFHLDGRGLTLVPSYFCWNYPVALADPSLPPVLIYPLNHEPGATTSRDCEDNLPLAALIGGTRAVLLRIVANGASSSELARLAGISPATVTFHTRALRDAKLISSQRHSSVVLHVLTPLGAALLRGTVPSEELL
ncbi:helix-turn-helix domain-containing protein [Streptomyces sp. NPDC001876]|uniref:ArsR/SmtB family transcription factor n=1 Tax=Streptomyces sp. NPDC001876 TaxID=3154402 RepID=UPI00332F329A